MGDNEVCNAYKATHTYTTNRDMEMLGIFPSSSDPFLFIIHSWLMDMHKSSTMSVHGKTSLKGMIHSSSINY